MDNIIFIRKTNLYHHWLKIMSEKGQIYKAYSNHPIKSLKEGRKNGVMFFKGPKLLEGDLLPNNENYKILQVSKIGNQYYIAISYCE